MRHSSGARSGSPSSVPTTTAAASRQPSTPSNSTAARPFSAAAVREAMGGLTVTAVQSAASARAETRPSEFQHGRYARSGGLGGPDGRENSRKRTAAKPLSVSVPRPAPAPPLPRAPLRDPPLPRAPRPLSGSAASARPASTAPAAPAPDPQTSSRVRHPRSLTPNSRSYISSSSRDDPPIDLLANHSNSPGLEGPPSPSGPNIIKVPCCPEVSSGTYRVWSPRCGGHFGEGNSRGHGV